MEKNIKQTNKDVFSKDYLDRMLVKLLIRVGVFAIVVTVIGILATPLIMSVYYSWRWMFLYSAYLIIILLVIAFGFGKGQSS